MATTGSQATNAPRLPRFVDSDEEAAGNFFTGAKSQEIRPLDHTNRNYGALPQWPRVAHHAPSVTKRLAETRQSLPDAFAMLRQILSRDL
jgi:hypothetical protein